ncbi:MAG: SH3 domain-containing protein [Chloroflexota bacterium]
MEGSEETIGRYRLVSPLEQPQTYIAYDPIIQREVTLRLFSLPAGLDREPAMYARDFLALAKLDHPNLVPIYDTGEAGERIFVVMKRLQPSELNADPTGQSAAFGELYRELSGIGAGLDYLYLSGYNPTSLTTHDLLTDGRSRPVLDYCSHAFFYYNFVEQYLDGEEMDKLPLRELVLYPSRAQMLSPEEKSFEPLTQASYTYSLTSLLNHFTSGPLSSGAESDGSQIDHGVFSSLLAPLIEKGLQADPALRFQSADELLSAVRSDLLSRFEGKDWESILKMPIHSLDEEGESSRPADPAPRPPHDIEQGESELEQTVHEQSAPSAALPDEPTSERKEIWRRPLVIVALIALVGGIFYFSFIDRNVTDPAPAAITSATETPAETESLQESTQTQLPTETDTPTETLTSIPTTTPEPEDTAVVIVRTATPTLSPTPTSSPTATETSTPTATPTPAPFFIVEPSSINLREGPSIEYDSIGFAYEDEFLEILAKTPDESWLNVRTGDGATGWVNTLLGQIVPDDDLDNLPLAVTLPPLNDN